MRSALTPPAALQGHTIRLLPTGRAPTGSLLERVWAIIVSGRLTLGCLDLSGATLSWAYLYRYKPVRGEPFPACLYAAILFDADLSGANLSETRCPRRT